MDKRLAKDLAQSVADFYENHGEAFSRTRHQHWDVFDLIYEACEPGMVLVDVGAGNGRLAEFLPTDVNYTGFEPSSSLRGNNPSIFPGTLPKLPAADESADIITCLAVFHHIPVPDQKAAVEELVRITKIGGLLVVTAWHLSPDAYEPVADGWRGDVWIDWKAEGAETKRFVHLFTEEDWQALWTHPCLAIDQIGFDKNKKNRLVVARKTC
ncbi:class I SAM-dependent methyltransferase [Candidatus Uhrbacteria bacterium]|nr:class I SAM-dependent methyltransferase [Candidatus Uhrbacteria bacterium]